MDVTHTQRVRVVQRRIVRGAIDRLNQTLECVEDSRSGWPSAYRHLSVAEIEIGALLGQLRQEKEAYKKAVAQANRQDADDASTEELQAAADMYDTLVEEERIGQQMDEHPQEGA
jgi:membrane protein required for beta-lactamase induction